ncbi:delta(1)-pyrroline-2-carboxylate reductase family protein [Pseudomonas sp. KNUC1026]|uniref:delta(1)-pyrroline-2-carboxylate reductase family protein n=1 Tax=Pseudomonas sp. KNUC1026 TaxID=2893890 RepID=UPI001F1B1C0F|nr:delta(1)-pyrroline-2-carboxylate reductase family protein [Pseudomonas sp. KNUC1026]UFH51147.1 delta(1)-pyrroline-2-carboxylate reductase family protein [Pseudomonas sp. KNUC1026]
MAPNNAQIQVYDAHGTAQLLDYPSLVDAIAVAAAELERGAIPSPERMVVPLGQGGVMLSMPATAADLAIHKLVNVQPGNAALGLPTIHGAVSLCDARTGEIKAVLDGPEVTGRRTAAVSLLAIRTLLPAAPREVLLYGTGVQARHHVQALAALYPQAKVWVRSRSQQSAEAFCQACAPWHSNLAPCPQVLPHAVDVVITLTTSLETIY